MVTNTLVGNFWTIFHTLEEDLEIQRAVAEASHQIRAFHCPSDKLYKAKAEGRAVSLRTSDCFDAELGSGDRARE